MRCRVVLPECRPCLAMTVAPVLLRLVAAAPLAMKGMATHFAECLTKAALVGALFCLGLAALGGWRSCEPSLLHLLSGCPRSCSIVVPTGGVDFRDGTEVVPVLSAVTFGLHDCFLLYYTGFTRCRFW